MKTSLRKTKDPCEVCFLHKSFCICDQIPILDIKTRISLVVHYKELKRTSNTGRLATTALINSEMFIRGKLKEHATDLTPLIISDYENLLLYPSDDAEVLTPELVRGFMKPVHLIVPDGNWRQAAKVHSRHKELAQVKRVKLTPRLEATQFLRKEHIEGGMATLEAIAEAMHVLEGAGTSKALNDLYQLKLQTTLKARGLKTS